MNLPDAPQEGEWALRIFAVLAICALFSLMGALVLRVADAKSKPPMDLTELTSH